MPGLARKNSKFWHLELPPAAILEGLESSRGYRLTLLEVMLGWPQCRGLDKSSCAESSAVLMGSDY